MPHVPYQRARRPVVETEPAGPAWNACERCQVPGARDFIPDARQGWRFARRLCAACCDVILDQRAAAREARDAA